MQSRGNESADILMPVNQIGDTRLDTFQQMDVRAEKNFSIRAVRVTGSVDVLNVFNANTVLTRGGS